MKIAILGYGTIGKGVEKLAEENGMEVAYILMRDCDILTKNNMTKSIDEIVEDESVDVVIECIGGDEPAFTYASKALKNKHHFLSSNKKMIEKHYMELVNLANKNKVSFLFSSACGGGIPWLKELSEVTASDELYYFEGIMNGTSNYILYKIMKENLSFEEALKKAQELGYAEADPSDDIDGVDTANKTLLSLGIGFHSYMKLEDIFIQGIRHFSNKEMKYLKDSKRKCVLLGNGYKTSSGAGAYVCPAFVDSDSILYSIKENNNCFIANAKNLGSLTLIGQGAGSLPTASNIIRDLKSLENPYKVTLEKEDKPDDEERKAVFYLRTEKKIEEKYIDERIDEDSFILKPISIKELRKLVTKEDFVGEIR